MLSKKVLGTHGDVVLILRTKKSPFLDYRAQKKKKLSFGSTQEIGYEMVTQGLKEIKIPSNFAGNLKELSGMEVAVSLKKQTEGALGNSSFGFYCSLWNSSTQLYWL